MFIPTSAHRAEFFSPYMTKKSTNFLPSSAPPQEDKSKSFLFIQKDQKNPILPLPFPTSFQSQEKHQLISPLHQPTQNIQLSTFLTPHKLNSSPASVWEVGRLRNALSKGLWSGLWHDRLTKEQNPSPLRQIDSILLLCCLPHMPSRQRQPTFPTIPL